MMSLAAQSAAAVGIRALSHTDAALPLQFRHFSSAVLRMATLPLMLQHSEPLGAPAMSAYRPSSLPRLQLIGIIMWRRFAGQNCIYLIDMVIKLDINDFMMITNLVVSYRFSKRKKNCEGSPLRGRCQGQALRVCFEKIFLLVSAALRPKEYFSSQNLDIGHSVG